MAPRTDVDSAPFWAALREHRIVLQRCAEDGKLRFPPMPSCPHCGTPGGDEVEVAGEAQVYSWVTVHRPLTPAMADEVPYTIATVELPEGIRMVGRLEGEPADGALKSKDAGRLKAATLPMPQAVRAALARQAGHAVQAELDSHFGTVVYEIDILTPQGTLAQVKVHAGTGQIVSVRGG